MNVEAITVFIIDDTVIRVIRDMQAQAKPSDGKRICTMLKQKNSFGLGNQKHLAKTQKIKSLMM